MDNSNNTKNDPEKLPGLPVVGNQRKWDIIKVVMRALCVLLSIINIGELIAIETGLNALHYWTGVAYPVVSLRDRSSYWLDLLPSPNLLTLP
jgi:hypothetical protein